MIPYFRLLAGMKQSGHFFPDLAFSCPHILCRSRKCDCWCRITRVRVATAFTACLACSRIVPHSLMILNSSLRYAARFLRFAARTRGGIFLPLLRAVSSLNSGLCDNSIIRRLSLVAGLTVLVTVKNDSRRVSAPGNPSRSLFFDIQPFCLRSAAILRETQVKTRKFKSPLG